MRVTDPYIYAPALAGQLSATAGDRVERYGTVRGLGHARVASSHRADSPNKAQAYAEEHLDQAGKRINEVAGFAERDTIISTMNRSTGQRPPQSSTSAKIRTSRATRTSRRLPRRALRSDGNRSG